jgi:hypothetical protein
MAITELGSQNHGIFRVRPGGFRSVVAESVLVRHQLRILNRSGKRAPNLRTTERIIAGLRALSPHALTSQAFR